MFAGSVHACPPGPIGSDRGALPAVQKLFPFARPLSMRRRSVRRPFHPSRDTGPYRLPHDVADRLVVDLAPFRNRDAAFALAVFIARNWSMPRRVSGSFPIDRRALADRPGLELTEARVRGAIKTLEAVGFLDRSIPDPGSKYKATEDGLRRKPIWFVFGSDYGPAFIAANARAAAARGRGPASRRQDPPARMSSASSSSLISLVAKSPKGIREAESLVLMGEVRKTIGIPPRAFEPDSRLEAALENLRRAIGEAGRG